MNPDTPIESVSPFISRAAMILVMSVNPGFGGQHFITGSDTKITRVRRLLDAAGNPAPVEVDGGVDCGNAARLVAAGAEILVAGAAIFGTSDPAEATRALRAAASPQVDHVLPAAR